VCFEKNIGDINGEATTKCFREAIMINEPSHHRRTSWTNLFVLDIGRRRSVPPKESVERMGDECDPGHPTNFRFVDNEKFIDDNSPGERRLDRVKSTKSMDDSILLAEASTIDDACHYLPYKSSLTDVVDFVEAGAVKALLPFSFTSFSSTHTSPHAHPVPPVYHANESVSFPQPDDEVVMPPDVAFHPSYTEITAAQDSCTTHCGASDDNSPASWSGDFTGSAASRAGALGRGKDLSSVSSRKASKASTSSEMRPSKASTSSEMRPPSELEPKADSTSKAATQSQTLYPSPGRAVSSTSNIIAAKRPAPLLSHSSSSTSTSAHFSRTSTATANTLKKLSLSSSQSTKAPSDTLTVVSHTQSSPPLTWRNSELWRNSEHFTSNFNFNSSNSADGASSASASAPFRQSLLVPSRHGSTSMGSTPGSTSHSSPAPHARGSRTLAHSSLSVAAQEESRAIATAWGTTGPIESDTAVEPLLTPVPSSSPSVVSVFSGLISSEEERKGVVEGKQEAVLDDSERTSLRTDEESGISRGVDDSNAVFVINEEADLNANLNELQRVELDLQTRANDEVEKNQNDPSQSPLLPPDKGLGPSGPKPRSRFSSPRGTNEVSLNHKNRHGGSRLITKCSGLDTYLLHQATWLGYSVEDFTEEEANDVDHRGHTALEVAIMLYPRATNIYMDVIKQLLDIKSDPHQRGPRGWKLLDEATAIGDFDLLLTLYHAKEAQNRDRWLRVFERASRMLSATLDFYCEIKWCIESVIVPFVGYFAPNDTLKFWKHGKCLRLDSTLANWSPVRGTKRRALSIIFNPDASPRLTMVNHDKQRIIDPSEALSELEIETIVRDLLTANEPVKWDVGFTESSFSMKEAAPISPLHAFFGGRPSAPVQISNWPCVKMDLKGCIDLTVWRKGLHPFHKATFEQYFGFPLPPDAFPPDMADEVMGPVQADVKLEFKKSAQVNPDEDVLDEEEEECFPRPNPIKDNSSNRKTMQRLGDLGPEPKTMHRKHPGGRTTIPLKVKNYDMVATVHKTPSVTLWISDSFPISMEAIMPLLDLLAHDNEAIQKARQIMRSPLFDKTNKDNGFPVKVRVPLNFVAAASITFQDFQVGDVDASIFDIPNYPKVARSEAQMLKKHRKRRLLISNLL